MQPRIRLLKGATALLYFGPLLAGLGGFGWAVVPLFTAIFILWLFILRPRQWPRNLQEWARPEAVISLVAQGAVQLLVVVVCFGVGRGVGGVLGALPAFPLMLPVGISFLSIPLVRLLWDPWHGDDLDQFLRAPQKAKVQAALAADHMSADAVADGLMSALQTLPADTGPEVLEAHLRAMSTQTEPISLRLALIRHAQGGKGSALVRRALVVHATMPEVLATMEGTFYPFAAFQDMGTGADLQVLFAERGLAVLHATPSMWNAFPSAEVQRAAAARARGEPAAALHALAAACEAAAGKG